MSPRASDQDGGRAYRLAERATLGAAKLDALVQRGRRVATAFMGGLLTGALDTKEMNALTIALYGLTPSRPAGAGLDAWERAWYEASLPSPPGRVLVTAAGKGREVAALREMGFAVDAFEPAPGQADVIARGTGDLVLSATYDDLVRAGRGATDSPAAPLFARRYDAVVLGWGSFTHLLDVRDQAGVLAACDALCPNGPILVSFWPAVAAAPQGRARKAGRRAGRAAARLRGRDAPAVSARGVDDIGFAFNVGFTRRFSRADIEALAASAGREVALFAREPYGHATLTPLAPQV